jgi:branched-chain amino acid transport system ATP-binding protein
LINRPEGSVTKSDERYETKGVTVDFAGLRALDSVDLSLRRREIVGLIGPNGAGKTTLLNVMTGVQATVRGDVYLDEERITDWTPERIAHRGVGRTFQGVRIFPDLTVLENVEVGAVGVGVSPQEARRRAVELVEWIHLADKAYLPARSLPAGDERRLGIVRALAMRPRFILMDEPGAGLNETESDELMQAIRRVRERYGCGVLVIEHDMRLIMGVCDRVHVLNYGKTISMGTPDEVQTDRAVITAYLGTERGSKIAKD